MFYYVFMSHTSHRSFSSFKSERLNNRDIFCYLLFASPNRKKTKQHIIV